jgi:HEAT repeat protein
MIKRSAIQITLCCVLAACASQKHVWVDLPPNPSVPPAPSYTPKPIDSSLKLDAQKELLAEITSPDPFIRSNAIEALSDVDPADASAPVCKALTDSDPAVRFSAAMAAGEMKLVDANNILTTMLNDRDIRVQASVRFALHRLGDTRKTKDLEWMAVVPDPKVRATVAMVLGLLKEPSAEPMLKRLQEDRVSAVRIQAAESLWLLGDQKGLEDLVSYSLSSYPDDQIVALQALAEPKDQRVIQHVRIALTSDYKEVALAAARGLGVLGSDEGWSVAIPAAGSKDPRQRALAALAMGAIGRTDLQHYLADLLKDGEPEVRISAATAILQLRPPA